MRLAACRATVVLILALALSGRASANDCPPPDAFGDSTVPGCPSNVVEPSAPIDDGIPGMAMPPSVDPSGSAIPYVEEITAPPTGVSLTVADPE